MQASTMQASIMVITTQVTTMGMTTGRTMATIMGMTTAMTMAHAKNIEGIRGVAAPRSTGGDALEMTTMATMAMMTTMTTMTTEEEAMLTTMGIVADVGETTADAKMGITIARMTTMTIKIPMTFLALKMTRNLLKCYSLARIRTTATDSKDKVTYMSLVTV